MRIVSMVPSITETLFDLGCDQEVVGITHYCEEPPHWQQSKARVGGTKLKDAAAILALHPDLVILNKEENLLPLAEQLQAAKIDCLVTFPKTVVEAEAMVQQLGEAVGRQLQATDLVQEIRRERQQLRVTPFNYLALIWKKPYMTIGDDTFMHSMLALIGGNNAAAKIADVSSKQRYFVVNDEQIAALNPDWVIFPDEPYKFTATDIGEFAVKFSSLTAVQYKRLVLTSGKNLTWFGSRMLVGMRFLRQLQQQMRLS